MTVKDIVKAAAAIMIISQQGVDKLKQADVRDHRDVTPQASAYHERQLTKVCKTKT